MLLEHRLSKQFKPFSTDEPLVFILTFFHLALVYSIPFSLPRKETIPSMDD
jgi:hypothetical protein